MSRRKVTFYDIMVYVAYGYFFLLGAAWFIVSLGSSGFNYQAFIVMLVFGVQAYFRHRLTDLIIGVLMLGLSIFMLLQALTIGKKGGFDGLANTMIVMSVASVVMSLILMFSYVKLGMKNEE
jgi:dolichyl-phosphate-mannose--protein O-mannosyl transferase